MVLIADLPAGMEAEVLGSFQGSQSASTVRVHVGQLVSGQEVPIVLKLTCPTGTEGHGLEIAARLEDRDGVLGTA